MTTLSIVISDAGDGSNCLYYIKGVLTEEQIESVMKHDKYDAFASGDGFQVRVLTFPEGFDLDSITGVSLQTVEEFVKTNT